MKKSRENFRTCTKALPPQKPHRVSQNRPPQIGPGIGPCIGPLVAYLPVILSQFARHHSLLLGQCQLIHVEGKKPIVTRRITQS